MAWTERRKAEFSGVPADSDDIDSSQVGHKWNNSISSYLKNEKQEVIIGGYVPSVTDGTRLKHKLIENQALPHPQEALVEGAFETVPVCIGLTSVENVFLPQSYFQQVIWY